MRRTLPARRSLESAADADPVVLHATGPARRLCTETRRQSPRQKRAVLALTIEHAPEKPTTARSPESAIHGCRRDFEDPSNPGTAPCWKANTREQPTRKAHRREGRDAAQERTVARR